MIITIDGPTASGKSTVAQLLAQKLGYDYLNSGLLYRYLAYSLIQAGYSITDFSMLSLEIINQFFDTALFDYCIVDTSPRIIFKHCDITDQLKTACIDQAASMIAINPYARHVIVVYQLNFAAGHNIVADGRDCGTTVFSSACYKFFLTASLYIRAQRWQQEQARKGNFFTLQESQKYIQERDIRDSTRVIAPLMSAPDAYIIDNSNLTIDQTVAVILSAILKNNKH